MFIDLVFNKNHFAGIKNANEIIQKELQSRLNSVYSNAAVRAIPSNSDAIRTDAGEHVRDNILKIIETMMSEKSTWINS